MDHGGNLESCASHSGRDARQADRIRLLGHVERRALVEHGARVDRGLGNAERRKPRTDRLAAPDRAQAHGEDIEPGDAADPGETREIVIRQLRVEESERPGTRPDHGDPLLDGRDRVGARDLRGAEQAERLRAVGGELRESVPAPRAPDRAAARHERELLIRDRLEPSHTRVVRDSDEGRSPRSTASAASIIRRGVRGAAKGGSTRTGAGHDGEGEKRSRKTGQHEEVGGGRRTPPGDANSTKASDARRPKAPR